MAELLVVLRRLAAFVGRIPRLSELLGRYQSDRRLAATVAAGVALVLFVVFKLVRAWRERLLRDASKPTRGAGDASSGRASGKVGHAAEELSGGGNAGSRQAEGADGASTSSSSASAALAMLRKRLAGVRRMTIATLGTVLLEEEYGDLRYSVTVREGVAEALATVGQAVDIYLITRCEDDETEMRVLAALQQAGIVSDPRAGGARVATSRWKALFCSTAGGTSSIVRQLEPDLHVDTSPEIVSSLQRFVPRLLYVQGDYGSPNRPAPAANVVVADSFVGFLTGAPLFS